MLGGQACKVSQSMLRRAWADSRSYKQRWDIIMFALKRFLWWQCENCGKEDWKGASPEVAARV